MSEAEKVWVEIETNKGISAYTNIYRGLILREDLNHWTQGTLTKKTVHLQHTYWPEEEVWIDDTGAPCVGPPTVDAPTVDAPTVDAPGVGPRATIGNLFRVLGHGNNKYHHFTGEMYLLAEHIVIISIIKDDTDRNQALKILK